MVHPGKQPLAAQVPEALPPTRETCREFRQPGWGLPWHWLLLVSVPLSFFPCYFTLSLFFLALPTPSERKMGKNKNLSVFM